MYFQDRIDAGLKLADPLKKYVAPNAVLFAIPRGGLPVAKVVSNRLKIPLDIILSKKIGHPDNPEFAIGAVSEETAIVNPGFSVSMDYLNQQIENIQAELSRRRSIYLKNVVPHQVSGKTVIIIDDGAATGFTLLSTIKLIQRLQPGKIIIALPVASPSALARLRNHPAVSEVICLHCPDDFVAVGNYYANFRQLNDEDVVEILQDKRI